ncbi:MAG: PD-(D/E)XK nuclease family protein [Verrucomicrobia bacterium]|nr:PD-(D/E)XK nuclease family protein [Verrucomicrobiota bacterium]
MISLPETARVTRHFLTWARPLPEQAVAWLTGGWSGAGPLDLGEVLVVVPTRQSGRRLREALAEHADARGQAVFPPHVMTPDALVAHGLPGGAATRLEALLAWAEVLRTAELEEFREVFPVDPPVRNAAWALQIAGQLSRLQAALGEGGLRIADVADGAGGEFPEGERWRQLARLERAYDARLAEIGRRDERAVRIAAAAAPTLPAGVEKIVLLATPDPLPLALRALAAHAQAGAVAVEVGVHAPPDEAGNFDAWGRPVAESWGARTIELPEFARRVQLCANPAAQAERIVAVAQGYAQAEGLLVVGVADAEVLPLAENALGRAGIAAFNPEGRARVHDGLYALLAALAELAAAPGFEVGAAVLRCPDVLEWLRTRVGGEFSAAVVLKQLDELRGRHLPPTLAAARAYVGGFPALVGAFEALSTLRATLTTGTFPDNAAAALGLIFAGRRFGPGAALVESAGVWTETLRETGRALEAWGGADLTLAEKWAVALGAFALETRTAERPAGALDLLGWLELLWEDTPHLVVAGLNDGRVPEALRVRLGLKTNAERLARDAYLLTALAGWRHGATGRLEVLLGKTSDAGDPLRPSRLLFRCADAALPARVAQLFGAVETARPNLPWARAWPLRPRRAAPRLKVSVTALRDWLACPFRFYLKHGLRMERVDPAKDELDARDFGTLVHYALQQLGESAELADCADADRLREFLLDRLERVARLRHGTELTLPLLVQLESARQRLRATAEAEARERAAGWRTVRVEWEFEFPLGGLTIRGKIDRIDRHADGRVRVIDYKTSDTAVAPEAAHWRAVRDEDAAGPAWRCCTDADGKPRAWKDLQLPMYLRAVAAEWGDTVACGYFNLPKAAGDTALIMWEGYSRETQAAAERCAEGVAAAVIAEEFWPPKELTGREAERDDFAELFHHGAAASIAWGEAR